MSERLRLFCLIFLFFGLGMGLLVWWQSRSLLIGGMVGIVSGTLFSLAIFVFTILVKKFRAFGIKKVEGWTADETIIHSGDANMIRNGIAEGGQLFLSNKRLRFVGHRFGSQILDSSYAVSNIAMATASRTLGIVPNGVTVSLYDGRVLKLVVFNRKKWVEELTKITRAR